MWLRALAGLLIGAVLGGMVEGGSPVAALALLGAAVGALWHRLTTPAEGAEVTQPVRDWVINLQTEVADLTRRIARLERELAQAKAAGRSDAAAEHMPADPSATAPTAPPPPAVPITVPEAPPPTPVAPPPAPVLPPPSPRPPQAPAQPVFRPQLAPAPAIPLRDRLPAPLVQLIYGGNTLVKVGVLILFLGLAFLLRYTAERVTVPMELRYAGVALSGVGLLALGWVLRHRRRDYGLSLQGMGVGIFYLVTLSAVKLHTLIAPEAGFAFMTAIALLGSALAVLQNAPVLAIIAALEGFASPVLMSTGSNRPVPLFVYLTLLDLGIFAIAWFKAWRVLNLIGFVGTFTLTSAWVQRAYTVADYGVAQPFLLLFTLLFATIGLLFSRRTLREANAEAQAGDTSLAAQAKATFIAVGRVDSALVFGTPLTAMGLQYALTQHWPMGPAFSALGLGALYVALARWVFSRQNRGLALLAEAYAIVSAIFLTLAIPLGLEGQWTGAAWAVEGAGMFWLGARQGRPYARLLALVVLIGASVKLCNALTLDTAAGTPLLHGSWIGPVLLAISGFVIWALHRRLPDADSPQAWQRWQGPWALWLATGALVLLPWQALTPPWAAVATAWLALAYQALSPRPGFQTFAGLTLALRVLAVLSFLATLHVQGGDQAALADGWLGGLAAGLIAASILIGALWHMVRQRRQWITEGVAAAWSLGQQSSLVTGLALLHLATLFALRWNQAAMLWPLTAVAVLALALRMAHRSAAALALVLQQAALAFAWVDPISADQAMQHQDLAVPLALSLGALASGWLLAGEARRPAPPGWQNLWAQGGLWPWLATGAGLLYWLLGWRDEGGRWLASHWVGLDLGVALDGAVLLITSALALPLARWRGWRPLGVLNSWTTPALVAVYLLHHPAQPSAQGGWWLWPLALVWHVRLLRELPRWLGDTFGRAIHLTGFWFFVGLLSWESALRLGGAGHAESGWPWAGAALVPIAAIWVLSQPWAQSRWPVRAATRSYLQWGAAPLAMFLLGWIWLGNIVSAGDAAPLPYIPLINPLELAQALAGVALLAWWRQAQLPAVQHVPQLAAATGLAWVTGLVLRTVHHSTGVAWTLDALWDSRAAQASVSIVWAVLGVGCMLLGARRAWRSVWVAGAGLLAVVVLKLLLVEMADHGGIYRIVSFIGVGVLVLLVGYFAPVPPKASASASDTEAST